MSERLLGDAELHAYVDGELSPEDRRAVEAWLTQNPDLQRRLQDFAADRERLRGALAPVLEEPLPPNMTALLEDGRDRRTSGNWRRMAAALAIFALGSLTGWTASQQFESRPGSRTPQIAQQAIDAHLVYLPEVRHPVEVGADQKDHLVAWLSKRLGHPLRAPDLTQSGFVLVGGRLLPAGGAAAAQFMYQDERGERLTLLVALNPDSRETAFKVVSRDRTQTFYWFDGPFGYALTGEVEEERLLRLARTVYAQFEQGGAEG